MQQNMSQNVLNPVPDSPFLNLITFHIYLETMRPLRWAASIMPPSIWNSAKASSTSEEARMTSSSSDPPAILVANRVTIWVKFMGPSTSSSIAWASPPPMLFPWAAKAATRSEEDRRPSLSVSMIPKASLNCWIAEWEKDSKMLAFLGILVFVGDGTSVIYLRVSPLLLLQP